MSIKKIYEIVGIGRGVIQNITPENLLLIEKESVSEHNETFNKQGGNEELNEFFHVTEEEHTYLTDIVENDTIGLILDAIAVPPTYVAPTNSISNVTQTVERGSTVSINITQTFTQNDAGALVLQEIQKDNVQVSTTSSFSESLIANAPTTLYRGLVTYAEGLTKLNNLGISDPTGKITAGTITSAVRTVTTKLRQFFGSVSATPTNSAEVRALASNNFETTNQFNLSTGTTNTTFIFAIPANKEKSLIIDTTNLNVDITSQYLLIDDEFVVNDIGGTPHNYKLYRMQVGAPYGTSANHQINVI